MFVAYLAALACTVAPDAVADPSLPVRLAQTAVDAFPEGRKAEVLVQLGAANFRAGMQKEAIRSLTEAVQQGENTPRAWAYLAMAHLAAGHQTEAREWIDRLRTRIPSPRAVDFWDEVEIKILSREVANHQNRLRDSPNRALPENVFADPPR